MPVKKQHYLLHQHRAWALWPVLWAIALGMLMFRGGTTEYWGPLETDLTNQFYPWRVFLHRWLERGVFAFWDPHMFSGYPTIETQQMLNLNPLYQASMWLDPRLGLSGFTALNTLIACTGMVFGLRRWGQCSWMAAALGAGLYTFGALFAVRVMAGHITVVSALAWWPLAALSVLRIVRSVPAVRPDGPAIARELGGLRALGSSFWQTKGLRRLVGVSAAAHAMVCLAGAPQYIVYLFYIDIAVWLAAARRWTWSASLGALASVWVVALLVSAPQWLPAFWYLPYTGRATTSSGMSGFSFAGTQNILMELLMPFPFGDDITRGHLHFKNVWETATYPGALSLILSLALVIKSACWATTRLFKRTAAAAPFTPLSAAGIMVFLFGCYMMVGGWLPGFAGFREPQKARALLAFGFALMSVGAFDGIIRRGGKWLPFLIIATVALGVAMAATHHYGKPTELLELIKSFGSPMDPLARPYYQTVMDDPASAAARYRIAWLWACASAAGLLFWIILRRRSPVPALLLFYLFLLADPFLAHAPAWVARHPWEQAGLPTPVKDYLKPKMEASRDELPWRVILNSAIINRTHHVEGLYEFHGYDPLMPAFAVGRMLVGGAKEIPSEDRAQMRPELLRRVGVRYDISAWSGLEPLDSVTSETALVIAPGASLFDVTRNVKAGSPGINTFGPDLDGKHYVVPADAGGKTTASPDIDKGFQQTISALASNSTHGTTTTSTLLPGESIIPVDTGRPDEFGVKVELTAPALVVYKGTWLPGWRVILDDKDQGRALFANNWMCGAVVPAGEHEVVFRYRPVAWVLSWLVAGLGLVSLAALVTVGKKKEKPERHSAK